MNRRLNYGIVFIAGCLVSATAWANCTSALSAGTCSATVSATPLAFGSYNPGSSTAKSVTSTVTVSATLTGVSLLTTIGYSISLGGGVTGVVAKRQMAGGTGGQSLGYNLYTTGNYDVVWGIDGVTDSMTAIATVLGTRMSKTHTVYGRVPEGQYLPPGSNYSDTIVVTVNY